jgi:hypothetical protein
MSLLRRILSAWRHRQLRRAGFSKSEIAFAARMMLQAMI